MNLVLSLYATAAGRFVDVVRFHLIVSTTMGHSISTIETNRGNAKWIIDSVKTITYAVFVPFAIGRPVDAGIIMCFAPLAV